MLYQISVKNVFREPTRVDGTHPNMQLYLQKAHEPDWEPWWRYKWAQEKLDGHRLVLFKSRRHLLHAFTTRGHDIAAQCDHNVWFDLLRQRLKPGEHVDGELLSKRAGGREGVKTALAQGLLTHFVGFATNLVERAADVTESNAALKDLGIETPKTWRVDVDQDPLLQMESQGLEGVVLKDTNYGPWMKRKFIRTVDLVIIGTKDGRGQHLGLVGSLVCAFSDDLTKPVANVGGFTKAQRVELSLSPEDLIHKVVEVKFDRVGSLGRLQHPRFVAMRPDKSADACPRLQIETDSLPG